MTIGTLKIKSKKNKKGNVKKSYEFFYTNSEGQYRSLSFEKIPKDQISSELLQKIEDLPSVTLTVEFEEEGDRIIKLREQGVSWPEDVAEPIAERSRPIDSPKIVDPNYFHNPYNFVPALPRDSKEIQESELGDRKPSGHGRYLSDHWSGRISVKLTTVTPLLIPDAAEMTEENDHKTYPVRLGADGKPYLPPTSIKGMLRSAYEAVTNSRLSVLEKHDELLAYRLPPNSGLLMVPARIENDHVCLYPGTSEISDSGKPRRGPMYAAWLRRWNPNNTRIDRDAITFDGTNDLPSHNARVKFWAEKFTKGTTFEYWKVRKVVPYNSDLGEAPEPTNKNRRGQHQPVGEPLRQFEGYVCVTNKNMPTKHDERIFFSTDRPIKVPLSDENKERWTKLIESYQDNEDFKNGLPCPAALRDRQGNAQAHWSRHFGEGDRIQQLAEKELTDGTLCYAQVERNGSTFDVVDLHPVMISRSLYDIPPIKILHPSLRSARSHQELSPADRVFGWVNQSGQGSYKGQLRIHSVTCLRDDAVDDFGSEEASFPLAILGQPKPEQARFYCADNEYGKPLHDGENDFKKKNKGKGYSDEKQNLRGRKVYPHHKGLSNDYWNNPVGEEGERTQHLDDTNRYQEYRRPRQNGAEKLDKQNRSIKGWVKPETTFEFDIDVINLSPVELGALLWLLTSSDIHYHRLGGAKPLGFGSVWLDIDWEHTDLRLGSDWRDFYQSLIPVASKSVDPRGTIKTYQDTIAEVYGSKSAFEKLPFIAAFCNASKGFYDNAAIHYPRSTPNPTPEGEAFKWFVENDKSGNPSGRKLSLPDLSQTRVESLPLNPTN